MVSSYIPFAGYVTVLMRPFNLKAAIAYTFNAYLNGVVNVCGLIGVVLMILMLLVIKFRKPFSMVCIVYKHYGDISCG